MKLLDLYAGGGGAAVGYSRVGFQPYGIDNNNRPLRFYPFPGLCMDALEALATLLTGNRLTFSNGDTLGLADFTAIHTSPPCQFVTTAAQQWRNAGREYPDLIAPTREALKATGKPYVIESVPGAPLINPILLNGAAFGMNLRRRRLFETSFALSQPLLPVEPPSRFKMGRRNSGDDPVVPVGHFSGVQRARTVMGIDWPVTRQELAQMIPPAYTAWLGQRLMEVVRWNV